MATVRAKMYISTVSRQAYDPSATKVEMQVVTRGDENKEWASATPQGAFWAIIKNPLAADLLADRLGQEFYVDITPVEDVDGETVTPSV